MDSKKKFYENQANTIIKAFKKRQIEGYYCATAKEAKEKAINLMSENSTISWGGSKTLDQIGIKEALKEKNFNLLDRSQASSNDEVRSIYLQTFDADYYLMSSNAITLDGKLINIDGNGNRIAALIYGPKNVIVIAGMNKVTLDEDTARKRVRNMASPPNTVRLNCKTPCATTGMCHNCFSEECICCQILITRFSRTPNRIKVILVGEELGF